jgi:hypothetical protein
MSVAKKIIKMSLSTSCIDDAIKQLKAYRNSLDTRKDKLLEGLGEIGVREASVRFATAMYDGTNDSSVSLENTKNGYVIVASGHAVAFIEFGAGVYHNSGEPYPDPRPDGIVGIGEYGKGHGKRQAWGYKDESGELVITHGNPAAMPMWYASEEMRSKILKIAKEVFGN